VSARRKYCKPLTLCAGKADEQLTSSNLWQSESKTIYIEFKGKQEMARTAGQNQAAQMGQKVDRTVTRTRVSSVLR
jgi:hypothetical protein